MIVGLAGSPWALEAMKTPEDVMGHSVVYITGFISWES